MDACRAVMQQVQRLSNVSTIFLRSHQTGFLCTFNCISWKKSKYLPGAKCAMILSSIYLPLDDSKSVGNLRQSSNSISPSLLHIQHHHHHQQQYHCLQQQHHYQQHHNYDIINDLRQFANSIFSQFAAHSPDFPSNDYGYISSC